MKIDRLQLLQIPVLLLLGLFLLLINANANLSPTPDGWVWHYNISPPVTDVIDSGIIQPYPDEITGQHSEKYQPFVPIEQTVWDFHPNRFPGKHGTN